MTEAADVTAETVTKNATAVETANSITRIMIAVERCEAARDEEGEDPWQCRLRYRWLFSSRQSCL